VQRVDVADANGFSFPDFCLSPDNQRLVGIDSDMRVWNAAVIQHGSLAVEDTQGMARTSGRRNSVLEAVDVDDNGLGALTSGSSLKMFSITRNHTTDKCRRF